MSEPDPNDSSLPLSRWESFILGLLVNVVQDARAQAIRLQVVRASPEGTSPFMLLATEAGVDGRVRQHYRVTVERAVAPPEDDEA